jgi:hypothetical protein
MGAAVAGVWALLLGMALLMVGNGLQGSLLGVRASLEGFPTTIIGLLMSVVPPAAADPRRMKRV